MLDQAITHGLNLRPGSEDDGWVHTPPVTLADGTRVMLLKDGEALRLAFDAIADAKRRICIEVYIIRPDATGRALVDLLCCKSRAGVKVYLIYDSLGTESRQARQLIGQLRAAGVRVGEFHPIRPWECRFSWRPGNRDHRKLLVIDDGIAGLGGLNVGDEYAGTWITPHARTHWLMRDTAIGITGPAARVLLESFVKTWRYIHNGGRIVRAFHQHHLHLPHNPKGRRIGRQRFARSAPHPHPVLTSDFGLLASVPTLVSPLRTMLRSLLRNARTRLRMIMAYFAPDHDLIDELCSAARRGVQIQLVFAAASDWKIMMTAARSYYETLMRSGVEIFERQGAVLHAKMITIDGRLVVVGSTNFDARSIEFNCELTALIDNPQLATQADAMMDHDIAHSRRIEPEAWRRRPTRDRLTQWLVSRLRYLL